MNENIQIRLTAMQLLERMFEVEMKFIRSGSDDVDALAEAFHPDVVVHDRGLYPIRVIGRG